MVRISSISVIRASAFWGWRSWNIVVNDCGIYWLLGSARPCANHQCQHSSPLPHPTPQLWDEGLVAPVLFGENFWTSRPSFLHLQNEENNKLSFAFSVRISRKKGIWRLFCKFCWTLCIFGASFLFPLLLMSQGHLWSWKDELVQRKKWGLVEESLSKAPECIGVLGSMPSFVTTSQIPPFSASLIYPCLRPTQGELETSGRVSALWSLEGGGRTFWCGCCGCWDSCSLPLVSSSD